MLSRRELLPEKRQKYVGAIVDTADRAAKLTAQLLAFARRQPLRQEIFDAAAKISAIADMLRTVVGSRIELIADPACAPCFIKADASQSETALVNMAVNARDAMNGAGRITIAIEAVDGMPARRGHAAARGDFAKVSVADTGSGITPDRLERIFEPFFTTKEVGKGTGLGLSQVHGFTKQAGGSIDVESEVGRGTAFHLYLPRSSAPADVERAMHRGEIVPSQGRILVVEDNEQVGEFASQLLGDLGYETRRAGTAPDAVAILERDHDMIDIVFSDIVMPGLDGVELGRQVRSRWPDVTVVLTSGYSDVIPSDAQHDFQLLHKPYSVDELSRALGDACRKIG